MKWKNGIHDDYYNICKAKSLMDGNETNSKIIWEWIGNNSNKLNVDNHCNIIKLK